MLDDYVKLAKELETHGAHMLAIKDMAGVAKPRAAKLLVMALKEELSLPVHFQTHDTSGAFSASALTPQDSHLLTKCNGLSQQS